MSMSAAYLDACRDAGQDVITHVGLVDDTGTELASAAYARQPVPWTDDSTGMSRLGGGEVLNTTAGDVLAGWRGYTALTGGTDHGGADVTQVTYSNDGTYTLLAASTTISHTAS